MDPYPYQLALAQDLDDHTDLIVGKSRQIGVSELLADYARYQVELGRRVLVISRGQELSADFLRRSDLRHSASALKATETQVQLSGGGVLRALPATEDAGRGYTADVVIVDEAAYHPWAAANYRAYRPTMADGGQLIIVSTGNGAGGFFHDMFRGAQAGRNGFAWRFYGADARPRPEGWYERERIAYAGLPGDFTRENPLHPDDMFLAHSGLVYGLDPDDGVAIFEPTRNLRPAPVAWAQCHWRIAAIDPGGSDPTAIIALGITTDERMHVYGARRFAAAVGAEPISETLSRFAADGSLDLIVCDPSQRVTIETLAAMGWPCYPAQSDKAGRISLVASLLKSGRLTVEPSISAQILEEVQSYYWRERRDMTSGGSGWDTATSGHHHADLLDALGYACLATLYGLPGADIEVQTRWR